MNAPPLLSSMLLGSTQGTIRRRMLFCRVQHQPPPSNKSNKLFLIGLCLLSTAPFVDCKHQNVPVWDKELFRATNYDGQLFPEDIWKRSRQRGWQVLDLVSINGGGDNTHVDRWARSFTVWTGVVVACQSLGTILANRDDLIDELASKLLSEESARAVKTVRTIIAQFSDHGVIDVFKQYPPKDVIMSILALAKLHRVVSYVEEQNPGEEWDDLAVLKHLAHYAVFANAAYGWKMDLAFRFKINRSDLHTLLSRTGIEPKDVVVAQWESKTHRPAYFIVRDRAQKKIVLCIRGTLSARDVLTDLCCTGEEFETGVPGLHKAHHGMLEAARGVAEEALEVVAAELQAHPEYSLVLVGHSLGGGVCCVLGALWDKQFPGLQVYGFGTPCVGPLNAFPTRSTNTISVIGDGDPFSRLSLGHIANLSMAIAHLCENEELRALIAVRTDGPLQDLVRQDLDWCIDTMNEIRLHMKGEQMFPPGRILYVKRCISELTGEQTVILRTVPPTHFQDLRLHARMLDISRHVPALYESLLQEQFPDEGIERGT